MLNEQNADLHLKFSGKELPEGTIDVYDLANTIIAIGHTIEGIAKQNDIQDRQNIKIEVSALKPGSFEVDLYVKIAGAVISAAPLFNIGSLNQAKALIDVLGSIIDVKKFLKGKKPKSVVVNQKGANSSITIINIEGQKANITIPVYNALQSKSINEGVKKIFEPLAKEGGNVDLIELSSVDTEKPIEAKVVKDEFQYLENTEELQTAPDFKIKGVISAFDRKTNTGRISLQDGKRPFFEILTPDNIKDFEEMILIIIESLKLKVPIYLIGEATLDYESNLKKIKVAEVKSEAKLL